MSTTFAPDDNPEVEHDIHLRGLPHPPKSRPTWLIFCHAGDCVEPAVWAIVVGGREIRLCLVHLDSLTETLISLRRRIREDKEA